MNGKDRTGLITRRAAPDRTAHTGRARSLAAILGLLLLLSPRLIIPAGADDATPADNLPLFQLETRGHIANVKQVFFVTHPRPMLISVGLDKTVRRWNVDVAGGPANAETTWRYQAEAGRRGQFVCAALNSGENLLAIGETGGENKDNKDADILLIHPQTGEVIKRLTSFPGAVLALDFNPEGTLLAALDGKGEISLFKTDTWERLGEPLQGDKVNTTEGVKPDALQCLSFSPDGSQLAAGGLNLYVWNVADLRAGKRSRARKPLEYIERVNQHITCLCWAHDAGAGSLVVGDTTGTVKIVSPQNESRVVYNKCKLRVLCMTVNAQQPQVAIGFDGSDATSGNQTGQFVLTSYKQTGGSNDLANDEHKNPITALAFSGDGTRLVSGDGMGAIRIWNPDTNTGTHACSGTGTAIYNIGWLSESRLCWSRRAQGVFDSRAFDLKQAIVTRRGPREQPLEPSPRFTFTPTQTEMNVYDEQEKNNREHKPCCSLKIGEGNVAESPLYYILATHQDNQVFAASNTGYIQEYDLSNPRRPQPRRRFTGCQGAILCLSVSPDQRYLAAGTSEQIIYLWSLKDAQVTKPLLCIYVGTDGEFVEWNPDAGYYEASPNGDALITWQFNKGPLQPAEIRTAEECAKTFYDPRKVREMFRTGMAPVQTPVALRDLIGKTPHVAKVKPEGENVAQADEENAYIAKTPNVTLRVHLASPDAAAHVEFDSLAGRSIIVRSKGGENLPVPNPTSPPPLSSDNETQRAPDGDLLKKANLVPGNNYLIVRAVNDAGSSNKVVLRIRYDAKEDERKGDLYVIAVGTTPQDTNTWNKLLYPQDDAQSIADVFKSQAGQLYNNVFAENVLKGSEATRLAILDKLKQVAAQAKENDTLVFFLAGHGGPDEKHPDSSETYFCSYDTNADNLADSAVPWSQMLAKLNQTRARRRILLIDHCFAGAVGGNVAGNNATGNNGADSSALALRDSTFNSLSRNLLKESHFVVLASSQHDEESYESADWGHGVFTKALLNAIGQGRAIDFARGGIVNMSALANYVTPRVQALLNDIDSRRKQTPLLTADEEGINTPLARLTEGDPNGAQQKRGGSR